MGDVVPDAWISSVQSIMDLMQAELDRLLAHKAELGRRRRNLFRRLDTLLEEPSHRRSGVGALQSSPLCAHAQRAIASARNFWSEHNELKRACRIALMEAGGVATSHEIYSHIVHRDSFSFTSLKEKPISAIVRTLNFMVEAGEVNRITGAPDSWQLMMGNWSCSG